MTVAEPPALDVFSPATAAWFRDSFAEPTPVQEQGWRAISRGDHALLLAPTGSGKTLAAFLWCLDRLLQREALPPGKRGTPAKRSGVSVLYISPLKALGYDVERNLRAPLAGLAIAATREGREPPDITIATRTGDTPSKERERIRRDPPDILITTPESLYLMLTSRAREVLRTVHTVIVDEIHTMAATKRGAHLSLSLERLEHLCAEPPQRIGLSATQRPLEEIARYLGGAGRVEVVDAGQAPSLDLQVIVPLDDMTNPAEGSHLQLSIDKGYGPEARTSIWPAVYPRLLEEIRAHNSTLIFVNNRRLAERIAMRVNDMAGEELVRTHHGSMSPEQRTVVEEALKSGQLPALVATSSLELGIDMGAIDLVIQVESPRSVARGLQRVGRAGHHVGAVSSGRIFPKYRGDLLECAVLSKRMHEGAIESTTIPRNPLDVLAQQIVAMCSADEWNVEQLHALVQRSYNFATLSRSVLENVLGMLAGHYPSDEFAELRPRLIWDRATDVLTTRGDARTIAVVNGGTIPDRGLYGVFLGDGGPRVGELDEEMVYESRAGETFLLGATSWRIEQITNDRVIVSPAPGEPGKMPFWRGDGVGRPLEFGKAIGAFTRELAGEKHERRALRRLQEEHDLDERAARNLLAYLSEQQEATGAIPSDQTIVIERYRDELGDWRVIILTPFGGQVHAPWAHALEASLGERSGFDVQALWSDDGIAIRFADGEAIPGDDELFPSPEQVEELIVTRLADSAFFASHFRENAARALLLPRRRPGQRTPLWLQRQRSASLMAVATKYSDFPIVLETYRECLRDVFDLPGLVEILADVRARRITVASVETQEASPFARSLLFDYIAAYMYEGDAPLAERRAHALTLDRNLLRDLLGEAELRELLDPASIETTELELQCLADRRKAGNADQLHDILRRIGDLGLDEIVARCAAGAPVDAWLRHLNDDHRACEIRVAGEQRWIAIEDAGHYRDGLGVSPPQGVPEVFLRPSREPLEALLLRYARCHGPFLAAEPASRWNLPVDHVAGALQRLATAEQLLYGDFRPGGHDREWCHPDVLRTLKRRSLAVLREAVEPVDAAAHARFLAQWQGLGSQRGNLDRLREVVAQLEGVAIPASVLERDILPLRVHDYQPSQLDELCAAGEVAWIGRGPLGRNDGRVALYRRENLVVLSPMPGEAPSEPIHAAIVACLQARGASFFADILGATGEPLAATLDALWDLVWAGIASNDTYAPVRATTWPRRASRPGRGRSMAFPPEAAGRWSLTSAGYGDQPDPTRALHRQAGVLLNRYGVVTRETVAAEGLRGGFSAIYPVFKAMEESGQVRRGYFIEGMGASQFALPGAVDRLRSHRDVDGESRALVLAATDPANPYGATTAWPEHEAVDRRGLQRAAGALVVVVDGELALYLAPGGRSIVSFGPAHDPLSAQPVAGALVGVAARLPRQTMVIEKIDEVESSQSTLAPLLEGAGFRRGYKGLTYRAGTAVGT